MPEYFESTKRAAEPPSITRSLVRSDPKQICQTLTNEVIQLKNRGISGTIIQPKPNSPAKESKIHGDPRSDPRLASTSSTQDRPMPKTKVILNAAGNRTRKADGNPKSQPRAL
jgi:hypothetical protein